MNAITPLDRKLMPVHLSQRDKDLATMKQAEAFIAFHEQQLRHYEEVRREVINRLNLNKCPEA